MSSTTLDAVPATPRAWTVWAARALAALPALALLASASMKLSHQEKFVTMFVDHLGYPEATLTGIGVLELTLALLYAIPQTSLFGAMFLTAYLGGATATHVRVGDPFFAPVILGVLVWAGLAARDRRVRQLLTGQLAR